MASPVLLQLAREAALCTACALSATRSQVVFASGDSSSELVIIGEAPGAAEDLAGLPFVGRSGKLLEKLLLEELGLKREEVYITNLVKCRPPENRNPLPKEIAACKPFLDGQLEAIAPKVLLTLGNFATRSLLQSREGITSLRGRVFEFSGLSLVPTIHPAAALRGGEAKVDWIREDLAHVAAILRARS
ncbi:MAG: uracil-DNA glycosylase [Actinobacteria bacterium]|nr:uracil-DNA glycosylase [Actinomycetota bacterium]